MNSPFSSGQTKKPQMGRFNDSIIESLRDLGGGVGKTVTRDLTGKVAQDALSSLFGIPTGTSQRQTGGELSANRTVELPQAGERRALHARQEFSHSSPAGRESAAIAQQIDAVRAELKALSASIKNLHQEINKTIAETPVDPGVYHVNFFERLRSIIKILRQQVDDSRTWLSLSGRRKKQKSYWGSYKKHGTQFGLSSERTTATQSG